MKTLRILAVCLLGLAFIGCSNEPAPVIESSLAKKPAPAPASPEVPDNLKNAGYEYLGLANSSPMNYKVSFSNRLSEEDGAQTTKLEKVEGEVATFQIERTGGLAVLGTETWELSAKGVSTVASSMGIMKSESLELPADLGVGTTWESDMPMEELQGTTGKITGQIKNKALREESLTVEAGTFDCIVIESVFNATVTGAQDSKLNGKSVLTSIRHYAKGVGLVKLTAISKKKGAADTNILIELKERGP